MKQPPSARYTILINEDLKQRFDVLCAENDITASQMMRQLIRSYIAAHSAPAADESKAPRAWPAP